jgi:hypothetical protein
VASKAGVVKTSPPDNSLSAIGSPLAVFGVLQAPVHRDAYPDAEAGFTEMAIRDPVKQPTGCGDTLRDAD